LFFLYIEIDQYAGLGRLQLQTGGGNLSRRCRLLLIPVSLLLMGFFSFVALHRFVDGDEGFYLLTSRLLLLHKTPYLDFFYNQGPLLPYVYAGWMKVAGVSWTSARIFAALLTTILGVLIYEQVCHETRRWIAALCAVVLFASATFVFAWFPVAKTFSLAGLLLFGAYAIVSRLPVSPRWLIAISGLLFGLSADTRSYVAGLAPVFVGWIFWKSEKASRIARLLWFAGGCLLGIAPSLALFAASPDRFLFNNLGFHAIRSDEGVIGAWRWKVPIARLVMFGAQDNGLQFTIVALTAFVLIFLMRMRRDSAVLAFLIAFFLGFICILPSPPHTQYFCMCMPFLIVAVACATNDYLDSLPHSSAKWTAAVACLLLFAIFFVEGVSGIRNYLITGANVIGIKGSRDAPNWTLQRVREVSGAIDELALPNEEIASFWPGYIFQSKALPYPGYESDMGTIVSRKLSPEKRARYHISSLAEIEDGFAAHTPRIVVVGNQESGGARGRATALGQILLANGYAQARTIGGTRIYKCCSNP